MIIAFAAAIAIGVLRCVSHIVSLTRKLLTLRCHYHRPAALSVVMIITIAAAIVIGKRPLS